jgi:hypothetical protein
MSSFERNAATFVGYDSRDQTAKLAVHDLTAAAFVYFIRLCAIGVRRIAATGRLNVAIAFHGRTNGRTTRGTRGAAFERLLFRRHDAAFACSVAATRTLPATIELLIRRIAGDPQGAGHHHGSQHFR